MWTNGAVVVVKHGDERIASAIEDGIGRSQGKHISKEDKISNEIKQKKIRTKILDARRRYAGVGNKPSKLELMWEIPCAMVICGLQSLCRIVRCLAKGTRSLLKN